jgi:S-layer homology domain/DKNYY family
MKITNLKIITFTLILSLLFSAQVSALGMMQGGETFEESDIDQVILDMFNEYFTDLKSYHVGSRSEPHAQAILYLYDNDIVQGYPDGSFQSHNTINRAEFLKIAMVAAGKEVEGSHCYPDVTDQWFSQYVCAATDLGLVEGYPDGDFYPEKEITFAEASKIVSNTFNLSKDESLQLTWYQKYVISLQDKYAIPLQVESFDHQVTRGEMSEIVARILIADFNHIISATYDSISLLNQHGTDITDPEKSDEFDEYVASMNIQLADEEIDPDVDEQISREIKVRTHYQTFAVDGDVPMSTAYLYDHKGFVYFFQPFIAGRYLVFDSLDPETAVFAYTGTNYSGIGGMFLIKDKNNVYHLDTNLDVPALITLKDLDPTTFQRFQKDDESYCQGWSPLCFYEDKNGIYYVKDHEVVLIEGSDPETFERLLDSEMLELKVFADKNYVYYNDYSSDGIVKLDGADGSTFDVDYDLGGGVFTDKDNVYLHTYDGGFKIIYDVDVETFQKRHLFGAGYMMFDDKSIFVRNIETGDYYPAENFDLSMADWFSYIHNDYPNWGDMKTNIFRYNGKVYCFNFYTQQLVEISEVNYDNLKVIFSDNFSYFVDGENVYILHPFGNLLMKINDANIDAFEVLGGRMNQYDVLMMIFKDQDNIYYTSREGPEIVQIKEVDIDSFEMIATLSGTYSRDKFHVYRFDNEGMSVENSLDVNTVKFDSYEGFSIVTDKNGVYYAKWNQDVTKFDDLDPYNLNIVSQDGSKYYLYDNEDIWVFSYHYSSNVRRLEGEDPSTFDFSQNISDLLQ